MKLLYRPVLYRSFRNLTQLVVRSPRRFIYRDASLGEWQNVKHLVGPFYWKVGDPYREWTNLFLKQEQE